jgi:hypothetical protein
LYYKRVTVRFWPRVPFLNLSLSALVSFLVSLRRRLRLLVVLLSSLLKHPLFFFITNLLNEKLESFVRRIKSIKKTKFVYMINRSLSIYCEMYL